MWRSFSLVCCLLHGSIASSSSHAFLAQTHIAKYRIIQKKTKERTKKQQQQIIIINCMGKMNINTTLYIHLQQYISPISQSILLFWLFLMYNTHIILKNKKKGDEKHVNVMESKRQREHWTLHNWISDFICFFLRRKMRELGEGAQLACPFSFSRKNCRDGRTEWMDVPEHKEHRTHSFVCRIFFVVCSRVCHRRHHLAEMDVHATQPRQ